MTSTEEEIRREMGLSKSSPPRRDLAPAPSPPAKEEVDVDAEVEKHPELKFYVDQDRARGLSESTIRGLIPAYKQGLRIEEDEDAVARAMGLPRAKFPSEPSKLEQEIRRRGSLV
jgi:hypothetical protein